MSKPYDAATKALIEQRPEDWLVLAGLRARGAVRVMDADLSTVTSLADKVIRVDEDPAWLLEIELQSSRDVDLPIRLFRYNALLTAAYRLLTRSVVVLLRQLADGPELTGRLTFPGSQDFRYDVIRVWEVPVGRFLDEGLGVLPLAPPGGPRAAFAGRRAEPARKPAPRRGEPRRRRDTLVRDLGAPRPSLQG